MTNERFAQEIVALTDTLYRVSYSILPEKCDREDAVQSCLEKAWKRRRALREERYLKTWLVRILINECYDIHRRRAREAPCELPEHAGPHASRAREATVSQALLFGARTQKTVRRLAATDGADQ